MFGKDQVTTQIFTEDLLYTVGGMAVVMVVGGLALLDAGLSRAQNVLHTLVNRLGLVLVCGLGVFFFGYAFWNWQFYQAFGGTFADAIKDWWLFGPGSTKFAQNLDPTAFPFADVQQVFIVFFVTFGMATISLIHSSVIEKIKMLPMYVFAIIIGLFHTGFLAYLVWGSAAFFTNRGVHDLEGVLPLYVFCGSFALILNWRLRPRLGAYDAHPSGAKPVAHNKSLVAIGVVLIMFGLPFVALASGYIVPGVGFLGISMTTSSWGIVLMNAIMAMCAGGAVGVLLGYWTKEWVWLAFGPIAGIVAAGAMLDIARPWESMFVAAGGPIVAFAVARLCIRFRFDELKIVPLGLGAGIYGAVMAGFVGWGDKTGGYIGITSGKYAFQHAQITPYWQLVGVGVVFGMALVTALPLALIFEKLGKFRVSEEDEIAGSDPTYWGASNYEGVIGTTDGTAPAPAGVRPAMATEEPTTQ
jgi:ammonium transporter, Amt family